MDIELRAATEADPGPLTRLFLAARRAAMPYLPELYSEAEVLGWMASRVIGGGTLVACGEAGAVLGFAVFGDGRLDHLYVAPHAQRAGAGGLLLEAAKAANPEGLTLAVFQRNAKARAFYARRGFRLIEERGGSANEENEPDAVYAWAPVSPAANLL